jgi:small nuclear ribonucleoprotein (snRNP)-like protein
MLLALIPSEILIYTTEGETFEAKLIGSDELTDLALLRIKKTVCFRMWNSAIPMKLWWGMGHRSRQSIRVV